ncbi:MAG: YqeG family HAD IIIA-type phosphatase [Lachnospiraceae bacterium]|nr:YqeG family HAD IIIA-type phosphatase [Lachnospiraceae bacterium]
MIGGRGIRALYPDETLPDVYLLTPEALRLRGAEAVIFDIDNTLVTPNAPVTEPVARYFQSLHEAGIRTFFVSNNGEERVRPFADALESGFFCHAGKPAGKGYVQALKILGLPKEKVIAVGDQLLTDIWGAGRAGIYSVLVDAVDPAHEQPFVRVKRVLEKPVRAVYRKSLKTVENKGKRNS